MQFENDETWAYIRYIQIRNTILIDETNYVSSGGNNLMFTNGIWP